MDYWVRAHPDGSFNCRVQYTRGAWTIPIAGNAVVVARDWRCVRSDWPLRNAEQEHFDALVAAALP